MTESNSKKSDKSTNTKEKSKVNENKKSSKKQFLYSVRAHNEGFNFSSLSEDEQEASKHLYTTEDDMSNFFAATCTMTSIIENLELKLPLRKGYGFPYSGVYSGYILNCQMTNSPYFNEYIMEILLDEQNVRLIKFTKSLIDSNFTHIYEAIKDTLGLRDTVFRSIDYQILKNMAVQIGIENIELSSGKIFSKLSGFLILDDFERSTKLKMIDLMFKRFNK